jgi:UDP-N-acetylglucosamine--N-acetylmuramyl-(pentapeptide) pyrophosphoryl-undecaprenol N-acetylglucosamine transferase
MNVTDKKPRVVIACGGTGGHLFPGIAVGERLINRNCTVTLLISQKEIDQQAVKNVSGMEIVALPAVGLGGNYFSFARGFVNSFFLARKLFKRQKPQAGLAMGGFTSAAPIAAAKFSGLLTFLHESNLIPGRANRWLARIVDHAFVGFPDTQSRLKTRRVSVTGTPVRPQFTACDPASARAALGLDPARPALLIVGGSQGASGINELVVKSLPLLVKLAPQLQFIHLTGAKDLDKVQRAYSEIRSANLIAVVRPFLPEMELALGAATVAMSRSGASSLAEFAAMQTPAVLVPFPAATDNHQFHNARAFETTGAAKSLEQSKASPESLSQMIVELTENKTVREMMRAALVRWHQPNAAKEIAENILRAVEMRGSLKRSESTAKNQDAFNRSSHQLRLIDSRPHVGRQMRRA